jgi:hypothetical protein
MSLHSIIVVNTGCNNLIEYQYDIKSCTYKSVQLNPSSNTVGPFDVYLDTTGSTALYSGLTRNELLSGITVSIEC